MKLQLETAGRINLAVATFSIVAWRLLWLTYQARCHPQQPCDTVLAACQWQLAPQVRKPLSVRCFQLRRETRPRRCLTAHGAGSFLCPTINKHPIPPKKPPSWPEAVRMIATFAGFLGRKGDGEPGVKTLWRGLRRLHDIAAIWKL